MIETSKVRYQLSAVTADGVKLHLDDVTRELDWEEQPEELAVRLTATIQNVQRSNGRWLHQLLPLGGKIFLHADIGSGMAEIFRGTIFRNQYRTDPLGYFTLTAYDSLIYLARSQDDRIYSAGTHAKTIIEDIAKAWQIPLGRIDGPNEALSKQVFRSQRLSQMISTVLDEAKKRGSGKYIVRSIQDKIDVIRPGQNASVFCFTSDNVANVDDTQHIEELVTRVKIVGTAKDGERRPIIATMDGSTEFGVLQELVHQEQYDTPAAARKAAQEMLRERGKPKKERKFTAPDVPTLRRGDKIYLNAGTLTGYFIVSGVSHDAAKQTMSLEVEDP